MSLCGASKLCWFIVVLGVILPLGSALAQEADEPKVGKLPHVTFDPKTRQVRVEAEALGVESSLEFFCVLAGTSEHESVLRTPAKPSHIHTALLAIGLKPGKPVSYSEAAKKWLPPQGPPLQISVEWEKEGKVTSVPAYRMMRNVKTKKPMPALTWVFCGSRTMNDGNYAADVTGYIVSVVNFDLTLIDIPELKSNANELLEWERNPDVAPPAGTKVTMIIEPAGLEKKGPAAGDPPANAAPAPGAGEGEETTPPADDAAAPPDAPAPPSGDPAETPALSDVELDEKRMQELEAFWLRRVRPHTAALREAAQAHYEVISAMRREQQRLIDEADRLQRAIDRLENEYQDITTPRPSADLPDETAQDEQPAEQ